MAPLCRFMTLAAVPFLLLPQPAAAQDDKYATDVLKKRVLAEAKDEDGWKVSGKVSASFSLNHNENVVGTDDGLTIQLGGVLSAQANFREGPHRWENSLSLQETQTRTPLIDRFIKSQDQLDILSTYTFRFDDPKWLGLFFRAALNTQIFEGELVAAEDNVEVRRLPSESDLQGGDLNAGNLEQETRSIDNLQRGDDFTVTDPFEPLNLRQSAGAFADPIAEDEFQLSIKLGIGAQEIIARGGDVLVTTVSTADGDVLVVRRLENFVFELGAEAEVDLRGQLVKDVSSYYLTVNAFYPPVTTSEVERDFGESINLRLKAGTSLKLNKALSIDYVLTVLRIPAVTTDFQVQNGLLLSLSFDLT